MRAAITFLRGWQGRPAGSTDTRLAPGVMATLVSLGTARWADDLINDANQSAQQQRPEGKRKRR